MLLKRFSVDLNEIKITHYVILDSKDATYPLGKALVELTEPKYTFTNLFLKTCDANNAVHF